MKEIFFMNGEIAEIISNRYKLTCGDDMKVLVSDEKAAEIGAFVIECYPAAAGDVCFYEI